MATSHFKYYNKTIKCMKIFTVCRLQKVLFPDFTYLKSKPQAEIMQLLLKWTEAQYLGM